MGYDLVIEGGALVYGRGTSAVKRSIFATGCGWPLLSCLCGVCLNECWPR